MKLIKIKSLITRLSDSLFASVPGRLKLGSGTRLLPPLRLVSHNPRPTVPAEPTTRRVVGGSMGQSESIDEAIRRSQAWFLGRQHPVEGFWVAELEADSTLTAVPEGHAATRRGLADLFRRAMRNQRVGQGLLCA